MNRRSCLLSLGTVLVLAVGLVGVQRCTYTPPVSAAFSYESHLLPRVFVSHHPLIPAPGAALMIRLEPDLPAGVSVSSATANLMTADGILVESRECASASAGGFECRFPLRDNPGVFAYNGSLELDGGGRAHSRARYLFTVIAGPPADALVAVRVPIKPHAELADSYRVDTAWARDPSNYDLESFLLDAEDNLFDGVLEDPAYRWRDDQLGFFVFTRPGVVTSYYSGRDTRCGKNPWPRDASFPAVLDELEVVGVLHRRTSSTGGIEGRATAPVDPDIFRDCAGNAVKRPTVGTFSATTGLDESLLIAKHEFGHAAFGQGDEYTEDDATRRVPPPPPFALGACCCVDQDSDPDPGPDIDPVPLPGIGTRFLEIDLMTCVDADGDLVQGPVTGSPPPCGENHSGIPDQCFAAPEPELCPPLAGDCVAEAAWLGQTAAFETARRNVFLTETACTEAAAAAAAHPGVEDPARSLGSCRQLCGAPMADCPCQVPASWIVDLDPADAPATTPADAMGSVAADVLHGGTCIWCVETTLCVRWQRSLGNDAETAWNVCQAPPKEIAQVERGLQALLRNLVAAIESVFRGVKF